MFIPLKNTGKQIITIFAPKLTQTYDCISLEYDCILHNELYLLHENTQYLQQISQNITLIGPNSQVVGVEFLQMSSYTIVWLAKPKV